MPAHKELSSRLPAGHMENHGTGDIYPLGAEGRQSTEHEDLDGAWHRWLSTSS